MLFSIAYGQQAMFHANNSGGGALFSPLSIPNLAAWYKSDAGVTLSGSEVIGWADQSGNARDLSAMYNTPSRPTVISSIINGYPVLQSNGYAGLTTALVFPNHETTGLTVFLVGLQKASETTDGYTYHHFLGTGDGYSVGGWNINRNFTYNQVQYMSGVGGDIRVNPLNDLFYSIRAKTSIAHTTAMSLNNGTETTGTNSVNTVTNKLRVFTGYFGDGVSRKQIAEIIIYLRELTSAEITQVENYLNNKYLIY